MNYNTLTVLKGEDYDITDFFNSFPAHYKKHCEAVAMLSADLLQWAQEDGIVAAASMSPILLQRAALYHDIGLVLIPERILKKKEKLSFAERRVVEQHTLYGGKLIDNYRTKNAKTSEEDVYWKLACEIALNHHERWDGTGYPYGQTTAAVPIAARIVAIADAYDTMIRGTPYLMPLPSEYAVLEIHFHSGHQFDPELSKTFKKHILTNI